MRYPITFTLDGSSIPKAVRQVRAYKQSMLDSVRLFMKDLIDQGVDCAIMQIARMDAIQTGELIDSIQGYYDANLHTGFIRTDNDHAMFVEFGTGIQGARSPYIDPSVYPWAYDTNNHGDDGWYYGNGRWTKGMPSRPFMYNTAKELYEACKRV